MTAETTLNIAVIGSGGREHALVWKLRQSAKAGRIYVLPGNGGTPGNMNVDAGDVEALERFCREKDISLIIVGPEIPLANGIVDAFNHSDIRVFGPDREAAKLESSKIRAKKFMKKYGVATAPFRAFSGEEDPSGYLDKANGNVVIKYDGLAAGKGVYVCSSVPEARSALRDIREKYGENAEYLIENKLRGEELSVIGVTDGKSINCFLPSQDHKAAYEGDRGPNTGGMGAYCPAPAATESVLNAIDETIILPTLNGIGKEGLRYRGVLYFGIMLTEEGPRLLEYNVRFGDPETEVILPALKSDLLEMILSVFDGTAGEKEAEFSDEYVADVVLTSGGYPGAYEKGKVISGLDKLSPGTLCFHAGTRREDGTLLTAGGRVLNIVCRHRDLRKAVENCYREIAKITFDNMAFRRDIAHRAFERRGGKR